MPLFKHKKTGARLTVVSEWDEGKWLMVEDGDGKIFTVYYKEIERDEEADKKVKPLQVKDAAAGEEVRTFPVETRLNLNNATPRMIADHIKGIGIKTAKEIVDMRMSLSGEKFSSLDQLKKIKRVDWESVIAADLIRV